MSNKTTVLRAISLFASTAAADPLRYRSQPERDRAWVIDAKGYSSKKAASRAVRFICRTGNGPVSATPARPISPSVRAAKSS